MSLAADLALTTLSKLVTQLNLTATETVTLTSPMMPEPVGKVEVYTGNKVSKVVYIGMAVPFIKLDSHMIFAFTPKESALPHFTLDSVQNDTNYAFHLDLIPRVDLGANLAYIDAVYEDLTEIFEQTEQLAGLAKALLNPRQIAVMSPWMLVKRADEAAFQQIGPAVESYLNHWLNLLDKGLPPELSVQFHVAYLAERDRRNREIVFNPAVDKVWAQVDRLVGPEMSGRMRNILQTQ